MKQDETTYNFTDMHERTIEAYKKREKREVECHIHPPGWMGASNADPCAVGAAHYMLGIMPRKTDNRSDKGGMWVGTDTHINQQTIHKKSFKERPSELHPTTKYEDEVYITVQLLNKAEHGTDLWVYSPIDESFIEPNEHGETTKIVNHQFKNMVIPCKELADGATFKELHDIKGLGHVSFRMSEGGKGLSDAYKAQGELYLRGSGLDAILFDMYSKEKITKALKKVYVRDDTRFKKIQNKQLRIRELKSDLSKIGRRDLDWFVSDEAKFICTLCGLSTVEDNDRGWVDLIKPCKYACKYIAGEVKHKFTIGSQWKRHRTYVTIEKYGATVLDYQEYNDYQKKYYKGKNMKHMDDRFEDWEIVVSRGETRGNIFIDTIYEMQMNFKER